MREDAAPHVGRLRRLYVLAVTTSVYFFYLLDRNAIVVTQELFKAEFRLSDTQVGLVTGILYGIAYATAGLPIGWLIQRTRRVRLLAFLVASWSGVTMLCGFATQFWHLAVARCLVGAAESGGSPVSLSILHPLFRPHRRATVSSIFFAGAGIGAIMSFMAGGFIAAAYGWRAVFLIYGLPGLALALLILFTLPETEAPPAPDAAGESVGIVAGALTLLRDRRLAPIYAGSVLFAVCNAGIGSWMVSFLMRVHDFALPKAGVVVALALGLCGTLGSVAVGMIADRVQRARPGGLLLVMSFAAAANGVAGLGAVLTGSVSLCVLCFCLWGVTAIAYSGPSNAAISALCPPHLTGVGFSLFAVLCNLIGAGLGPLTVGMISDRLHATLGDESVRLAIVAVAFIQLATVLFYALAMRRAAADDTSRGAGAETQELVE